MKIVKMMVCALALAAGVQFVRAEGPTQEAGQLQILNSGAKVWSLQATDATPSAEGANSLGVYSVAGSTYAMVISTGSQVYLADELYLGIFTTTQLGTKVPRRLGGLVFNETTNRICISTGINAGNYAAISTATLQAGTGNSRPCFQ